MRARLAVHVSRQQCELREIVLRDKAPEFLAASPKGTVPVLVKPDGAVIEESLEVMLWALHESDPDSWLLPPSGDLDAMLAALPDTFGEPVSLQRGDLRWRMAVPADGMLPFDNCAPALIEWEGDAHPASRLVPSGCQLTRLMISHPNVGALKDMLAPHLTDERLRFQVGPAGLQAEFDVAGQRRVLT